MEERRLISLVKVGDRVQFHYRAGGRMRKTTATITKVWMDTVVVNDESVQVACNPPTVDLDVDFDPLELASEGFSRTQLHKPMGIIGAVKSGTWSK